MKFKLLLLFCFITRTLQSNKRSTLTPNSDGASFSNEHKRLTDELLISINQGKIHTIDEIKRLQAGLYSTEQVLKTEISMLKAEASNNMKRYSGITINQITGLALWLNKEFPKLQKLSSVFNHKQMAALAKNFKYLERIDEGILYLRQFIDTIGPDMTNKFLELLDILKKIDKNTDLSNGDTHSLGNQIKDVGQNIEGIADAIQVIDRRLPGIDLNGDGISRNLQTGFDSLNLKLDGFTKLHTSIVTMERRMEEILSKISHQSYPPNDNHMPNAGNVPPVFIPPPTTPISPHSHEGYYDNND